MFETAQQRERVILIAVDKDDDAEMNLNELRLLAETAGAEEVGRIIQKRENVHPGHYFGKGKIDEIAALVEQTDADAVISDDELSPAQQKNLAQRIGVKILDRTMVILDIFAARAQTSEGKAQVELAQLKYRLSHLAGLGVALSRQAGVAAHGGVGNRGPGEKKLELDRRHIRARINQLNRELTEVRENRALLRKKRERQNIPVIALVGYTNAGKSTLMNTLTGANVLAENKLFATLDTTTRKIPLPNDGPEVLFTDTVGFINKLPHHLIQAFRATLEELTFADILIHVVDSTAPNRRDQMRVVDKTLEYLKCSDKPTIIAMNKCDESQEQVLGGSAPEPPQGAHPLTRDPWASSPLLGERPAPALEFIHISAATGENIPLLLEVVEKILLSLKKRMRILLPYTKGALLSQIYADCKILSVENREDGTLLEIFAPPEIEGKTEEYVC